jgi:ZIP family zinc transporter
MPSPALFHAFTLTLLAGLATGAGSFIALLSKKTTPRFLSLSLGFSAGVMIFVSLVELFNEARAQLALLWGESNSYWGAIGGFFLGMGIIAGIDRLVPAAVNPHEARAGEAARFEATDSKACDEFEGIRGRRLLRTGVLTGIATFFAGLQDRNLGITIALAVAIHNIPEGIAISVPVYYSTGSRAKAFWYSFASGLSEPIGAILGYLLLMPLLGGPTFGIVLASVAGIMI